MEKLARDKHSSLLQKSVHYGQKSFITLAPGRGPGGYSSQSSGIISHLGSNLKHYLLLSFGLCKGMARLKFSLSSLCSNLVPFLLEIRISPFTLKMDEITGVK
jgi:hypothetical protein